MGSTVLKIMEIANTLKGLGGTQKTLCLILLAALAYLCIRIAITFINPETIWAQPEIGVTAPNPVQRQGGDAISFTTNPFNRGNIAPPVAFDTFDLGEDAPETTLNLVLTGRTTGENASAILRTTDNIEAVFRIDDEVIPGVTLQAVNKDFIVLRVDGQIQKLTFERPDRTNLQREHSSKTTHGNGRNPGLLKSATQVKISNSNAADLASTFFQNFNLQPEIRDGQLVGYLINGNQPGTNLAQFGLNKGDVVTTINGINIAKNQAALGELFKNITTAKDVEMTVLRNGQPHNIKFGAF